MLFLYTNTALIGGIQIKGTEVGLATIKRKVRKEKSMKNILTQLFGDLVTDEAMSQFNKELGLKFVAKADYNNKLEEIMFWACSGDVPVFTTFDMCQFIFLLRTCKIRHVPKCSNVLYQYRCREVYS